MLIVKSVINYGGKRQWWLTDMVAGQRQRLLHLFKKEKKKAKTKQKEMEISGLLK